MKKLNIFFLLETIFLLGMVLLVDHFIFSGDRFWGVHPHPFFFIVLLISVQYGATEGLIAALWASTALLAGNMPEQSLSQSTVDYLLHVGHQPLLWNVSSILIGGFVEHRIKGRKILEKKLMHSQKQAEVFKNAFEISDDERNRLETHISGESSFILSLHQAALDMDAVAPVQILDNILEITQRLTKSEKCSWYVLDNSVLETNSQLGWEIEEPYSLMFTSLSPLFQEIIGNKRTLSILNREDEIILDGQGMLAGPIVSRDTEKVYGMLKIERLDFLSLNFQSTQTFQRLLDWLGALLDSESSARDEAMAIIATQKQDLFSDNYFERLSEFLTLAANLGEIENQSIVIRPPREVFLSEQLQEEVDSCIKETLDTLLGKEALYFNGRKNNYEYFVAIANISPEKAREISIELENSIKGRLTGEVNVSDLSFSIKSTGKTSGTATAVK